MSPSRSNPSPHHSPLRTPWRTPWCTGLIIAAAASLLVACGGDDEATDTGSADAEPAAAVDGQSEPAVGTAPGGGTPLGGGTDGDGSTVRDVLTDAMGADGASVDAAISSLSTETRFEVVVDRLDPRPTLEIDGSAIRFVFDSGSTQDAILVCMIGGSFVEPGETLTLVYPDGEQVC
jgi:hypothetical protein